MPVSGSPPAGIAGDCFRALAELGGAATTTAIRLHLAGQQYRTSQVRGALHGLSGRRPALAEVAARGAAGYGRPDSWRLTPYGATLARGYPLAGPEAAERCEPAAGHALAGRRNKLAEELAGLDDGELMYLILAAGQLKIAAETELCRRPSR